MQLGIKKLKKYISWEHLEYGSSKKVRAEVDGGEIPYVNTSATPPVAMRLLSLNVRGLGNPQTFDCLREYVHTKGLELVLFLETKMVKAQLESVRVQLGFVVVLSWIGEVSVGVLHYYSQTL